MSVNESNIPIFKVYSNATGKELPFNGGIAELHYYENILSETVRMSISVVDTGQGSIGETGSENIKLTGTEKVHIELEDTQKQKISFTTSTNELHITGRERITEKLKDIEFLELVSKEYLKNESVRVDKRYDGKISDSLTKILKEVLGTQKKLDIESTKNSRSFIGTLKKPFWFIMWLAGQSIREDTSALGLSAGYFFFETKSGYKFKSIDTLFGQTPIKKYIYNNTVSTKIPTGYDGKILEYNFVDSADMKDQMMMGTFNTSVNLFNSFESAFGCNPLDISTQASAITAAGTEYGKNLFKDFIAKPSRFFTGNQSIGGYTPVDQSHELDTDKAKYLSSSAARYNQAYTVKANITIFGDFSLEAGQLIYCDFPEQSTKTTKEANPRMSGVYMISALCHRIDPIKQCYTSLELIRDSYGRKPMAVSATAAGNQKSSVQKASDGAFANNKGVTDEDIASELNNENQLMSQQEQAIAETPPDGTKYDDEGYPADAGSEFEYNPVTGRLDPKD
jgi:hypothetical protein